MRPIDADALLDFLDVGHLRPPTEICFSELMMKNIINIQPTIDAVPVIRCKDCKYFELDHVDRVDFPTETGNAVSVPIITAHEICSKWSDGCKTSANGYCFMAERKEE